MSVVPDSALAFVAGFFDRAAVAAARAYVEDGRVHLVKPTWPIVARVGASASDQYVVTVHHVPESDHLRTECTCEARVDCEHAAAATLVVIARERELAAARAAAARQTVVGEWLAELGRVEPAPVEAAADKTVAYVLDRKDGEVGLTVVQCTRLRQGGLAAGPVIGALGDPHRGAPRWVETEDLRRIAMLRAVTRVAPVVTRLRLERIHGELLADLAGSGRLFWRDPTTPPLRYGPPRATRLGWQAVPGEADGYRLGVDPSLLVVPARTPHYLDPEAALLGPLELGVAPELVQRLVLAPPVPAAMRATVERSLGPILAEADLPATAAIEVEPMVPRLVGSLEDGALRLAGEAVYGDQRFALGAWEPERPAVRDLVAEGRARARLDGLLAKLPHGPRARSSLELLADARHVAEVIVPQLRRDGWTCVLDDSFPHEAPLVDVGWVERLRPLKDPPGWFALELGVTVAGRTLPLLPLLLQAIRDGQLAREPGGALVSTGGGLNLRLPDGELVHVPRERIERWLRPLVELELAGIDAGKLAVSPAVAVGLDDDAPGRFGATAELAAARARLEGLLTLTPRAPSAGFAGSLRDYQQLGHAWLRTLHDAGCGGLLADEMGLGKTVQVLAFLDGLRAARKLKAGAPALVVAPRSVVGTWQREAARFAPRLATTVHLGAERDATAAALTRAPLVITSYQTLVRDLDALERVAWTTVIFDEAQALKNPDTQARAAARALRAHSKLCITGTPIENHLGELWSQVDLVMPGLLGRRAGFDAVFRRPIERHGDAELLEAVRRRVRPFLLRRTKDEVALELPAKTEVVERIELDADQRDLYETLRLALDTRVQTALAMAGLHGAQLEILDALLKLRQCCCDPRLLKLPEARRAQRSAKLDRLLAMLTELADSGRRVLVFSQFTSMLALIERACAEAGLATLSLTGATRDRERVIDDFQAGQVPVLLVSLKAGGVGLTLTRADTVIHYDPWWNPAVEAQATDRAHRIGQDRPVMVYKLVARGTLEEAICELQDDKRQLMTATLRAGGVTQLSPQDLQALYQRIV